MNELLQEIKRCLKRLERSDTPLKRANARLAWRRAVREMDKEADLRFRPMRDDGSEIPKAKQKGVVCPYCDVPLRSNYQLLGHLRRKHGWGLGSTTCLCGKKHGTDTGMIRHLSRFKDLATHFAGAVMAKAVEAQKGMNA